MKILQRLPLPTLHLVQFSQRWVRSFDTPSFSLDASSGYAYVLEREHSRVQAFKSADGGHQGGPLRWLHAGF